MVPRVLLFHLPPAGGDFFPISLGYIAASLKSAGVEVVIEDLTLENPKNLTQLYALVAEFKPGIIGFSAYQWNMLSILSLAGFFKKINPSIKVVIGGPQATFMPQQALFHLPHVDAICRGEGEVVISDLARCLVGNKDMAEVPGILFRRGNKLIETAAKPLICDLDMLPSPYQSGVFDLVQHKTVTMLASRGCTFNCAFCYTPKAFKQKIRSHSVQRVLSDMEFCLQRGLRDFFFCDPSFTYDKSKVSRIMQVIARRRWKVNIWCTTRTDLVDHRLLILMARAGVKTIAYGLEAADPAVLRAVNKRLNLNKFKEVVLFTKKLGIETEVYSMFNLPAQDYASAQSTLDLLRELGIEIKNNSFGQQLCVYFGTAISDKPFKFKVQVMPDENRPPFLSCGFNFKTPFMSKKEVKLIQQQYVNQNLLLAFKENKNYKLADSLSRTRSAGKLPYALCKTMF